MGTKLQRGIAQPRGLFRHIFFSQDFFGMAKLLKKIFLKSKKFSPKTRVYHLLNLKRKFFFYLNRVKKR